MLFKQDPFMWTRRWWQREKLSRPPQALWESEWRWQDGCTCIGTHQVMIWLNLWYLVHPESVPGQVSWPADLKPWRVQDPPGKRRDTFMQWLARPWQFNLWFSIWVSFTIWAWLWAKDDCLIERKHQPIFHGVENGSENACLLNTLINRHKGVAKDSTTKFVIQLSGGPQGKIVGRQP